MEALKQAPGWLLGFACATGVAAPAPPLFDSGPVGYTLGYSALIISSAASIR